MRARSALIIVFGLCVWVMGCQTQGPRSYRCTATFAPRSTVLDFEYEKIATPEEARDKCMADAKANMPGGTREIGCQCIAR